jgi:hypothetical protein
VLPEGATPFLSLFRQQKLNLQLRENLLLPRGLALYVMGDKHPPVLPLATNIQPGFSAV